MRKADLVGRRFNRLKVIKFSHQQGNRRYWECLCVCGNLTYVVTDKLTSLHTKSCGCARRKHNRLQCNKTNKIYRVWEGMKQRCNNPNDTSFHNYVQK